MPGPDDRPSHFVVSADAAGERLDQFLAHRMPALSRAQIQRIIKDGHVTLTRGRAKPGLEVWADLEIDVSLPAPTPAVPKAEALPISVLHDDDDIVVVDKPAGMVVHPAAGHPTGTLVNALLHHVRGLSGIGGTERPGIVHRLDRGTSGVMVVAKHDLAHRSLSAQFQDRTVEKEYLALVWGRPEKGETMDRPIGRDPRHRQRMSSRARRARPATTRVLDVEPLDGVSLIRVAIATGRTHQIRVHLSEAHHPVVGDAVYGGTRRVPPRLAPVRGLERPFLHAARITIEHPGSGDRMTFDAALPPDLQDVLERLRHAATARTTT
jgi:23S rRNA pseudouridine1911/1915/1917 synthase